MTIPDSHVVEVDDSDGASTLTAAVFEGIAYKDEGNSIIGFSTLFWIVNKGGHCLTHKKGEIIGFIPAAKVDKRAVGNFYEGNSEDIKSPARQGLSLIEHLHEDAVDIRVKGIGAG